MNIATQKKILFIPIVNFVLIMFSWLLMYWKNNIPKGRFLVNMMKIFLVCFLITVPRIIIDKCMDIAMVENIVFYISIIIYSFIPPYFALKDQEKFELEKSN